MSYELQQNNDQLIEVPVYKDGSAINTDDLTEAIYKLYVRNKRTLKLTKELASGITSNGQLLTITITKDDCKDLVGVFYHELTVFDAANGRSTVFKGDITFQPTSN